MFSTLKALDVSDNNLDAVFAHLFPLYSPFQIDDVYAPLGIEELILDRNRISVISKGTLEAIKNVRCLSLRYFRAAAVF
jgi:Leucine-rich repeat (LRR) protein